MTLSITQKLTVTVAVLSLLTLTLAGVGLNLWMERGAHADATEKANVLASDVAEIIREQCDGDILVEPAHRGTAFDTLRVPFPHWQLVRENGEALVARGLFTEHPPVAPGSARQPMPSPVRPAFMMTATPLALETPLGWNDIPAPARAVIETQGANGLLIAVRKVILKTRTDFDVKLLHPDHIQAVEVTDTGQLLDTERRDLPNRLPPLLTGPLSSGQSLADIRIVAWQVHGGELVALVEGSAPNGETVQTAVNRFGEQYIVADGRVVQKRDESRLWVVVAHDMASDLAGLALFARATVGIGMVLWVSIVAVAWQVTKRALRPVDEIVARTARIDAPHLEERLPVGEADDELSRVARTVNRMLDRIQDGYRRERQFTGDASHEMRNPLAKMLGEIDWALSRDRAPKEYRETLERLQRYAQGMQRLTEALLILARLDGKLQCLEIKPFDVANLAMELVATLRPKSAKRVHLELGASPDPMLAMGHRHLVGVLLRNLIDNALRYSPPGSPVDLRIHRSNGRIDVEVRDAGPGIPPEQVALAFNRFHRLEESRSRQTGGAGLGLSIVQAVADVHNTEVTLDPGTTGGTCAAFSLPCADAQPNASAF